GRLLGCRRRNRRRSGSGQCGLRADRHHDHLTATVAEAHRRQPVDDVDTGETETQRLDEVFPVQPYRDVGAVALVSGSSTRAGFWSAAERASKATRRPLISTPMPWLAES